LFISDKMPHERESPDFKVNEFAVSYQKQRYEESLAAVQEEKPELSIVKQRALAAKKVRWDKEHHKRTGGVADEHHMKDLHRKCKEKNIGGVCSAMTYKEWKKRFDVTKSKRESWSSKARQDLQWGVVQAANSNNKELGESTVRTNDTALGKAITAFKDGNGLCTRFTDVKISIEALVFLATIRDRTSLTIPSVPGSISHLYANNKRRQHIVHSSTSNPTKLF
jgi:hypothetical protein